MGRKKSQPFDVEIESRWHNKKQDYTGTVKYIKDDYAYIEKDDDGSFIRALLRRFVNKLFGRL